VEKNVDLVLDDAAKDRIIEEGSDLDFGARPLKRAIEKLVEDPLSEKMLRGDVLPNTRVDVTAKDGDLIFTSSPRVETPPAPTPPPSGEPAKA
jgi:ATP-dependent Clp protease ATP-binding subunit ClpC